MTTIESANQSPAVTIPHGTNVISPLRADELIGSARHFLQIHDQWVDDPRRPHPDAVYWGAADVMLDAFNGGEVPAECRRLARAAEAFADEVELYDHQGGPTPLEPRAAFFAAIETMKAVCDPPPSPPLPPLESLKELRGAKGRYSEVRVSDLQICQIYGFFDRFDRPMPQLIEQELNQPGSVLKTPGAVDGRDWEDPRLAGRRQTTPLATDASLDNSAASSSAATTAKPCPETATQLWEQRVPVSQAAKMLNRSPEEVAELFEQFKLQAAAGEPLREQPASEPATAEVKPKNIRTAKRKQRRMEE